MKKKGELNKEKQLIPVLIQLIFWLHLPIVVLWFGLFLMPSSLWPGRITFHFWFIISIITVQFFWGLVYFPITRKIDIICPLTTLMQSLRGFPFRSRENYGHSFIAELLGKLRLKVSYRWVNGLLIVTLILIVVEYVWWK